MSTLDWLEHDTRDPRTVAAEAAATPVSDADRAIATLAGHEGWEALVAAILEHEDAWAKQIATQVVKGTVDLDPVKVARTRGYFQATRNVIARVEHARKMVDAEEES